MTTTHPAADPSVEASDALAAQVRELHERLHLSDVRVQRLKAEAFEDPPVAVDRIQVRVSPYEVRLEPPRLAARFTQTVTLRGGDEQPLAEVEVVLVIDYELDDGPAPSQEAVGAYVEHNSYFTAHPYLRETLQNATLKLGFEPVVLGVLSRDKDRPAEITLVRRRPSDERGGELPTSAADGED
ncbi:hypothetical protein [Streptomyces abyssomicinicus]|uniref:hypothetical protein n=1 Tax=Streptomyces abyssomicinicus TaxID=574929 RepID=UPI00124FB112|nr:hypothetical protein [Streptomyces abyssomicinicus]